MQKVTRVQLFCVEVKIRNQHKKENIFLGFVDILLVMPKTSQINKLASSKMRKLKADKLTS